jgi:hypothetical protein
METALWIVGVWVTASVIFVLGYVLGAVMSAGSRRDDCASCLLAHSYSALFSGSC